MGGAGDVNVMNYSMLAKLHFLLVGGATSWMYKENLLHKSVINAAIHVVEGA